MIGSFDVTTLAIGICGMGAVTSFVGGNGVMGLVNTGLCVLNICILMTR